MGSYVLRVTDTIQTSHYTTTNLTTLNAYFNFNGPFGVGVGVGTSHRRLNAALVNRQFYLFILLFYFWSSMKHFTLTEC
jgi:hypothetical protein